jgi:hypothetical protein
MESSQIVVTIGGIVLIGFILWFFFGPRAATPPNRAWPPSRDGHITPNTSQPPPRDSG